MDHIGATFEDSELLIGQEDLGMSCDFVENATDFAKFILEFHIFQQFKNLVISQSYCYPAIQIKIDVFLSLFDIMESMFLFVIKVIRFFV